MPRYRYEAFQVLDMQALQDQRVRISVLLSTHLQPGDELDLTPYGRWRVVELERDLAPDVTTVLAVSLGS